MTVQNTAIRKAGPTQGNGAVTVFPFVFKVFATSEVVVTFTNLLGLESTLALGADYTVSLNNDQNSTPGGAVNMVSPPVAGTYITVTSNVSNTQNLSLSGAGGFYPSSINDALDRIVIMIQQLAEQMSRAVKIGISSTQSADNLIANLYTAAVTTQAAYTSFTSTYYGASAIYPLSDPLGNLPTIGDLFFFTPTQQLQVFTSTGWQAAAIATPANFSAQTFNGNGSQTLFSLSSAPSQLAAVEVYVSGSRLIPTTQYNLSGSTLTFTTAPVSGTGNIFVRWTGAVAAGMPNDGSVTTVKVQDLAITTNKVADNAISYAKLQVASVTQRLLGRNSAGSGIFEEVSLSQLLDWIGGVSQGGILFRGASGWSFLAPGVAGNLLQTNGVGADPNWVSITASGGLGSGQTWQDVAASRAFNTTYTNSTGKPIGIVYKATSGTTAGNSVSFVLNGIVLESAASVINGAGGSISEVATVVIPNGSTYSINASGGSPTINRWYELR